MSSPHTIIEELDETLDTYSDDQLLAELLKRSSDSKAFLAAAFAHLKKETKFFDSPDASKVLARLLRDVNGPAIKATANGSSAKVVLLDQDENQVQK